MQILNWNNMDLLKQLPDNSVDSVVCDPPYWLSFMGKKWDYDVPTVELWKECLRVLKPWGHLLAFAGTRTQHRMAVRIEDAGFEIRDMIAWVYGSWFPKSLAIWKAINKMEKDEWIEDTKGTSEREWRGTWLKPSIEPITLARKPIEWTVAENCLKWGTGGINIDESRVEGTYENEGRNIRQEDYKSEAGFLTALSKEGRKTRSDSNHQWRFPANLIHDNSEEVRECFPDTKTGKAIRSNSGGKTFGGENTKPVMEDLWYEDNGNASRFFKSIIYQAKASKAERNMGMSGNLTYTITLWELDQKVNHLLDMEVWLQSDTSECTIKMRKGQDLSTYLYEKLLTDRLQSDYKYTIKTETKSTITSTILNWLIAYITKEYTVDVNWKIEFGENLVESVEWWKILKTTINAPTEYLLDAKNVVWKMQLIIKESVNSNIHSTVKPIALMEYLIKMVTKKWWIVLDPFMWSWTTGIAAKKNWYNFIWMELDEWYHKIAEARINAVEETKEREVSLFSV